MGWLLISLAVAAGSEAPAPTQNANASADTPSPVEGAESAEVAHFDIDVGEALSVEDEDDPLASAGVVTVAPTLPLLERGYLTLNTYLVTVPGFDPREALHHRWAGARGLTDSVNLMVDGVSLTSPIGHRNPASDGLFLEEFEQIETTSGPAGVLWGAHSLLGVVNLIAGGRSQVGTGFNFALGSRDYQRISLRDDREIGPGRLSLFLGYAARRQRSVDAPIRWAGVPPFTNDWYQDERTEPTSPRLDSHLTFSARYASSSVVAYLRLPYAREYSDVSRLGGIFPDGQGGRRQSIDGLAYVALQKAILDGRLSTLARVTWNLFDDYIDEPLFAESGDQEYPIRSVQWVRMSRFGGVAEASHRFEGGRLRLTSLVGLSAAVEIPHDSNFSRSDPSLNGALVSVGPVVTENNALVGSGYIREEMQLWERLSLVGGARYNLGGNAYRNVALYEVGAGVRLLGRSYLKLGLTEGMRPPTLLDRTGAGTPVRGSNLLSPERSRAFQAEANAAWEGAPIVSDGFVRFDFSRTTTTSNIVREGSGLLEFQQDPVALNGFVIDSLEAAADLHVADLGLRVMGMYYWKQVIENIPTNSERVALPLPNHGPRHRWYGRVELEPASWLAVGAHLEGEKGGVWRSSRHLPDGFNRAPKPDERDWGQYLMPGAFLRITGQQGVWFVVVTGSNLLDEHPPVGLFSYPELAVSEAAVRSPAGRTFFAYFSWRGAALSEL